MLSLVVIISCFVDAGKVGYAVPQYDLAQKKSVRVEQALKRRVKSKSYGKQAEEAFRKEKYDLAILLYRKHLRRQKQDYNAWNSLGASYYHTGLPKTGLRYLRNAQARTQAKSYNFYYQGLAYLAVGESSAARNAFTQSARYTDEYAARATFEMAVLDYNKRKRIKAEYWLNLYARRYPRGVFIKSVLAMLQSYRENRFIPGVQGNKKPDMEKALFRYNRLSFGQEPHFWFFRMGGESELASGFQPTQEGGLKTREFQNYNLLADAGIGIGPYRSQQATSMIGYVYRQNWITDDSRIQTYFEDFLDFQYQPFQADAMMREHQLFGDVRRKIFKKFYVGVFGRYDHVRMGSSLFRSVYETHLNKAFKVADRTLLIPWLGVTYFQDTQTLLYLYMRKELNSEAPEFSNKTYILSGSDGPSLSWGISHHVGFPSLKLDLNFEGFLYDFAYNDPWFDYSRVGGILGLNYALLNKWYIHTLGGYYVDTYRLPILKQRNCSYQPNVNSETETAVPKACTRVDEGFLLEAGTYLDINQFNRIGLSVTYLQNSNESLQIFEESGTYIKAHFTMAFPSVGRVVRYVDRFADSAFTKEAE